VGLRLWVVPGQGGAAYGKLLCNPDCLGCGRGEELTPVISLCLDYCLEVGGQGGSGGH